MYSTTYHNHSTWSDGTASLREMALAAREAGVAEFGISDHLVVGPRGFFVDSRRWSMGLNQFEGYVEEALAVRQELEGPSFHVRLGVEADYFPETWEKVAAFLEGFPLDYVIGAVHFAGDFPIDASAAYWERLTEEGRRQAWVCYAQRMKECARDFPCQWLAHLDLAKIYQVPPPPEATELLAELLAEGGKRGLCVEINTAGADKPCHQFYPSPELLRAAVASGVGILANADGHAVSQVTRHFHRIPGLLASLGVRKTPSFQGRKIFWHPLEEEPSLQGQG